MSSSASWLCRPKPTASLCLRAQNETSTLLKSPAQEVVCHVRQASSSAELRAAAFLRALSFYSYPADRSPWAQQAHRRMKTNAEWGEAESKVSGTNKMYQAVRVTTFIATLEDSAADPTAVRVRATIDPSCKLPADEAGGPWLVIGTLDVNQGARLPAEELVGWEPPGAAAATGRAYLSNVCVHADVRRQGIAAALVEAGAEHARASGVQQLYVHVIAANAAGVGLYAERCGFKREQAESEATARALGRPARLLLRRSLGP
ncbi:hypothetical protein WJX81_002854 [Elliptochloris bilobata]|uniref:N-acetyltransferase domain-containing protein n=1 Tax=Elliptochloris bilobata TaxID=381761 RepID=A0AAW1RHG2_9CHLO